MIAEPPRRTTVVDANILINLIHAGRLSLLGAIPGYVFVVPEDVVAEVTHPSQREQLDSAIAEGRLHVETITDPQDLAQYTEYRRTLGKGESACLVMARRHGWCMASDEGGRFRREAITAVGTHNLMNTPGLFVMAIRAQIMSIDDADHAKRTLERHRFRMPFGSFRELVGAL